MWKLLIAAFQKIIVKGTLEVESADGHTVLLGDGSGQPLGVKFENRAAERRLLLNPELAFGELFSDGDLTVTRGTIYDIVELMASNVKLNHPTKLAKMHAALRRMLRFVTHRNTKSRSKKNAAHHYDLDVRFYDLFLDVNRQYSCAYFERPDQNLDDAQLSKMRHLAAKLHLKPGQPVLDIGSGWGGLAFYLSEQCGANVTGITLSQEQLASSKRRGDEQGSSFGVEFNLQDYRTVTDKFDRIVSVGMFEHVGFPQYENFFGAVARMLSSDGIMVLHSIGRIDGPGSTNPWIEKYIFPGGYAPALSEVLPSIERSGLIVTDLEILHLHYADTLRSWRQRFIARRKEAVALTDERFCRMWEFYLAACECAFRHGGLMVFQIQLSKRQDVLPSTRNYIALEEATLRLRDGGRKHRHIAAE